MDRVAFTSDSSILHSGKSITLIKDELYKIKISNTNLKLNSPFGMRDQMAGSLFMDFSADFPSHLFNILFNMRVI